MSPSAETSLSQGGPYHGGEATDMGAGTRFKATTNAEPVSLSDMFHGRRSQQWDWTPRPARCLACDGPAPGVRVIAHVIVCRNCLQGAEGFSEPGKCFWCREEKKVHRFVHVPTGEGGISMCRECRDDFLKCMGAAEKNKRTRQILRQGSLFEVSA